MSDTSEGWRDGRAERKELFVSWLIKAWRRKVHNVSVQDLNEEAFEVSATL